jgi:CRISPR-associated protein Cas5d
LKHYCLEVTGDFACFTRPEMKVERVSYDVMTPSAARAVFEAILWKPAIRWRIQKIEVLQPIRWISLRRNEVGAVVPVGTVKSAMHKGVGDLALYIEDERQQRAGLFLRDVAYRLHAALEVLPEVGINNPPAKFWEMFERRASKGQCVNQPYLGCREFACDFRLAGEAEPAPPIADTRDLGWMLHDMDFTNAADPKPRFFRAELKNGVLVVPDAESPEVRG